MKRRQQTGRIFAKIYLTNDYYKMSTHKNLLKLKIRKQTIQLKTGQINMPLIR